MNMLEDLIENEVVTVQEGCGESRRALYTTLIDPEYAGFHMFAMRTGQNSYQVGSYANAMSRESHGNIQMN